MLVVAQTAMRCTEVVDRADQVHSRRQGRLRAKQTARPPTQTRQALPEAGMETLDVGGTDLLSRREQASNLWEVAHDLTDPNAQAASGLLPLERLHQDKLLPDRPRGTPRLAGIDRGAKRFDKSVAIRPPAIGDHQQRAFSTAGAHFVCQRTRQVFVAVSRHDASQPEASRDTKCQSHPKDLTLLAAYSDLIRLDMAGGAGLCYQRRVYLLTMLACSLLPSADGAFVEAEGGDDGRQRTALRQQGERPDHDLGIGFETVERRSLATGEGFLTDPTFPTVSQAVVDTRIACAFDTS